MQVLIAESEKDLRLKLDRALTQSGFQVSSVSDGGEAMARLELWEFDLFICEADLKGVDWKRVIAIKKVCRSLASLIILTSPGAPDIEPDSLSGWDAVMLKKPFATESFMMAVRKLQDRTRFSRGCGECLDNWKNCISFGNLISRSEAMHQVFKMASVAADSYSTAMIRGEAGTGKRMLAESIHYHSHRKNQPFISIACGSFPRNELESELFGKEMQTSRGNILGKKGRLELARKGTLFLYEIDDLPLETQFSLFNFIESGKFMRVGGQTPISAEVRILSATKKDIPALISQGRFRKDLYYKLNVLNIRIPPLRERPEDIPLLVEIFLRKYSRDGNFGLAAGVQELLKKHAWPGNVGELEAVIERLAQKRPEESINFSFLPTMSSDAAGTIQRFKRSQVSLPDYLGQVEKKLLLGALKLTDWKKSDAAAIMKIPLPTFKSKLIKYGLHQTNEQNAEAIPD